MRKIQNVRLYGVRTIEFGRNVVASEITMDAFFFPGGEPHINGFLERNPDQIGDTEDFVEGADSFVVEVSGGSFEDVGAAIIIAEFLENVYHKPVDLALPYLPGARQDKGTPLTGRTYIRMLNDSVFRNVYCADIHSRYYVADIYGLVEIPAVSLVPDELFEYTTTLAEGKKSFSIIAPDAGALDRAQEVADKFDLPLLVAAKKRDADNNFRVGEYSVPDLKTDYGVVIDDICDGGGTFIALADALDVAPWRLRLWTTHGIYSKGLSPLYARYDVVASTDSFRHERPMIEVPFMKAVTARILSERIFG